RPFSFTLSPSIPIRAIDTSQYPWHSSEYVPSQHARFAEPLRGALTGAAVHVGSADGGVEGAEPLSQQPGDDAGEHISSAPGSHADGARGIDPGRAAQRRDHRGSALEEDDTAE